MNAEGQNKRTGAEQTTKRGEGNVEASGIPHHHRRALSPVVEVLLTAAPAGAAAADGAGSATRTAATTADASVSAAARARATAAAAAAGAPCSSGRRLLGGAALLRFRCGRRPPLRGRSVLPRPDAASTAFLPRPEQVSLSKIKNKANKQSKQTNAQTITGPARRVGCYRTVRAARGKQATWLAPPARTPPHRQVDRDDLQDIIGPGDKEEEDTGRGKEGMKEGRKKETKERGASTTGEYPSRSSR